MSISKSIDFRIKGGKKLSGTVTTNYSKNGAMGLLPASLLNKGKTTLHGIPRIEEVNRILEVMNSIGVKTDWMEANTLVIQPPARLNLEGINTSSASKTRSIIMFFGSLIHHFENFSLPHSQGCLLGKRTINPHIYGLEKMGVKVKVEKDRYVLSHKKLKPANIVMFEAGDTATENLLMACSKIKGRTTLKYASANYMVQNLAFFLQKLGVKIEGIGTTTMTIVGFDAEISKDIEFTNIEDPIDSMTFLTAGIITESQITVKKCPIDFLELELEKLAKMGLKYKLSKLYKPTNSNFNLTDIAIYPSKLRALDDKITSGAYPDLNMDNLPFFVPIACKAKGQTLIHDWSYEDRAIYFMELRRLGAKMNLADPHRVFIDGPIEFMPAQLVCPPALRPAMIIMLSMLDAKGESILRNVYSIKRGYEEIAERLNGLGADIEVMDN
jgi:UDP-N-acetylglucosamine 1-carboxyvinyltransferase